MIYLYRPQTEPLFNIAAEEFVLKNFEEEVFMLWTSAPSVVVGKHQNTVSEVNTLYAYKNGIPVIRRISGGGTVVHGPGNLNYTQITTGTNQNRLIDFRAFTKPIMEFLKQYGIEARFEGKNNLTVEGKKFSGNSAHVAKNRIIHHGTLLYDMDEELLEKAIKPRAAQISDKSIPSVRATTLNLKEKLTAIGSFEEFKQKLEEFLSDYLNIKETRSFTPGETEAINKLVREKYRTKAWTFGYSPAYRFKNRLDTVYGNMQVEMQVEKGEIKEIELYFEGKKLEKIEEKLLHCLHEPGTVHDRLAANRFSETLLELLF